MKHKITRGIVTSIRTVAAIVLITLVIATSAHAQSVRSSHSPLSPAEAVAIFARTHPPLVFYDWPDEPTVTIIGDRDSLYRLPPIPRDWYPRLPDVPIVVYGELSHYRRHAFRPFLPAMPPTRTTGARVTTTRRPL